MDIPHSFGPSHDVSRAGGAYVRRRITYGDGEFGPGDTLTAEQVRAIPPANLRALINTGRIELWPTGPDGQPADAPLGPIERFAVHLGAGRYVVIEGQKITGEPVTREEADAIVAGAAAPKH